MLRRKLCGPLAQKGAIPGYLTDVSAKRKRVYAQGSV